MARNVATKILEQHLVEGELKPGSEISISIDHTLLQDATGTMAMLEFIAMGLSRVKVGLAAQYIDHNLLQTDYKNADDHAFLTSAAMKFGVNLSRPGNGVSHQVHLERFGTPGITLLGADSHSPTAAGLSVLAIGAGGLDVALAMAGHPFSLPCPRVFGVKLVGELPAWVSGKDVILEMLRRHTVKGASARSSSITVPVWRPFLRLTAPPSAIWGPNWGRHHRSFRPTNVPASFWYLRAGATAGCRWLLMKVLPMTSTTKSICPHWSL